jgi:hypothetical protein
MRDGPTPGGLMSEHSGHVAIGTLGPVNAQPIRTD